MQVAVVILNYNGCSHLAQFLPVLQENTNANVSIIVADNGSTDGSELLIKNQFPDIQYINLGQNYGFAGGYNRALAQIKADIYVLLNNDVAVAKNWLEPMLNMLENKEIAAVQPKLLSFNNPAFFEYAGASGGFLDWLGYPFCRGRIFDHCEADIGQYNEPMAIFWATGACIAIKSQVFNTVGGFDEDFFAHMEEIDLCWRIQRAGYQIFAQPEAVVYHVGGGTLATDNPFKTYLNFRNNLAMLFKNLPANTLFLIIFLRLILDGVAGVQYILKGKFTLCWAIIKAHFAFYGQLPRLMKKRQSFNTKFANANDQSRIYNQSILWQYFLKKKTRFIDLP